MKRKSVLFLLLMAMFMPLAMHAQKALPYEYGFENQDLAAEGWTTSNLETGSQIMSMGGSYGYIFAFKWTTNPPQYLISPELTGTEDGVNVSFVYSCYNAGYPETFQVGYSSTTNAPGSFTWDNEVTVNNVYTSSFETYEKIFPAGTKYIAVKCTSYDAYYLFVDMFSFTAPDLCATPSNLVSSDVTTNAATLSWEGIQDSYNVRYRTAPSVDFFEDFNEGIPSTWTTIDNDGDGNNWTTGQVGGMDDTYCATSASYINPSALTPDNWLCTPQIALDGTMKVWMRAQDPAWPAEHFAIYATTADEPTVRNFTSGTGTTLIAETVATGGYVEYTADLSSFNGQMGYIAIRHFNCTDMFRLNVDNFGLYGAAYPAGAWVSVPGPINRPTTTINGLAEGTDYEWQVQGICSEGTTDWSSIASFSTASACDVPVNLLASNITANSAELSWTGYQSNYNVQYRTAATRETYYFNDFNETESEGWTWNPLWIYGFEDPIYNIPSDVNYFMQMGWNSTEEETIISCELPAYESGSVVEFYYFGYSVANTFQVGYSSTTTETDAFTWGNPINAPLQEYTLYQEVLPAGTKYVAFKATAASQSASIFIDDFGIFGPTIPAGAWQPVNLVTNPYTLGGLLSNTEYEWRVQGICSDGNTDWSEIASFMTPPSCLVPTGLAYGEVTANSAVITWSSDASSFDVEVNGFVEYEGVGRSRITLENLEPGTLYTVRVRANCGEEDGYSDWTAPISFYTLCEAFELPYEYGFDDILNEVSDFICWTAYSFNEENSFGQDYGMSFVWKDEEQTDIMFKFSSWNSIGDDEYYQQILVSPELNATTAVAVQFEYMPVSVDYGVEQFLVGYSTTTLDEFEWVEFIEADNEDEWMTYSNVFPAGTKYVAVLYVSEWLDGLYVDNFSFEIPKTFVTDGDWDDANNWSPAGVPTAEENVSIEAEAIIPADYIAEVNNIIIGEDGSITIEDGGQLYHSTYGLEVTMKKNVPAYTGTTDNYQLLASPFVELYTSPGDLTSAEGNDFYMFDNSQPGEEWQNNKQVEIEELYIDEGYLYANPEDIELSLTGSTMPSNEYYGSDLNYEYIYLSYDDTENEVNGWYLLGNPFLVDAYIYSVIFGEDENGDYTIEDIIPMNAMYYDENGDMQTIEGGPIAPMQGFFVSVTEDVEAYIFPFDFLNAKNKPSLKSLKKNRNNHTIPVVKLPNIAVKSVNTMPATMIVKPMPAKTKAVKSEPAKTTSVKAVKAAPANTVSKKTMSITPMLDKKLSIKK